MAQNIEKNLFARLSELIQNKIGLFFPPERWHDLERGVRAAALELGFEDTTSCIQGLLGSPVTKVQLDTLVAHLTVGETFFLRDESHFNALQHQILPDIFEKCAKKGKPPRFWSAACCTGEEPYTMAMVVDRMKPYWTAKDFSILATDINSRFLEKARKGIYTNWSLRNAPNWMVEKYFTVHGNNRFEVEKGLKKAIRFTNLNLVDPVYPSAVTHTEDVNVVFCRNVLMYFNQKLRDTVIERIAWALADNGWFFVGPSEAAFVEHPNLAHIRYPGAIIFQKQAARNKVQGADLVDTKAESAPVKRETPLPNFPARTPLTKRPPRVERTAPPRPEVDRAKKMEPLDADRMLDKALELVEKGNYDDAVNCLLEIISAADAKAGMKPDSRAMALLARTYANMGKLEEARKWGGKAVDADKLNPGHRYLLATVYAELGDSEKAADLLQASLFLDSRFILAHFTLGNTMKKQGKANEARRHFKNALSLLLDLDSDAVIPHSGGMTAGRLTEIVRSMILGD
ncbi:MCP methyltransferase (CheR-type) [Desulfatibacillum aliphaticivorans]|uniref:MCP methyltransferase (CheR-type) n=1 Tax=Desulfatibacillum aliphaticivorans TaxID=218208 RepID=B8FNR6_DESAL|nr:MCP methyltransferase (CheR-type) [Desulfatibacillum aliphaticivorans]